MPAASPGCASTGNTRRKRLAAHCSATPFGFKAIIFVGSGRIAYGELAQALDHGMLTVQIVGDFDDAMEGVRQVADRLGIYLMILDQSLSAWRGRRRSCTACSRPSPGELPDWIVVLGGNLGNSSRLRQCVHRA